MSIKRKNLIRNISILLLSVFLFASVGCNKTALYHNLSEVDANKILVVLNQNGITAQKEKEIVQNETTWKITVSSKDIVQARGILVDRNLPRVGELGLGGVYQEKGLIPTPDEQKARFLLAIKGEIVNSLEMVPEIVDADVVINIPTPEEFSSNEKKHPTASVVIKVKPNDRVTTQITESKVQQFVANSVEDLNPRDVSVIISYLSQPKDKSDLYISPSGKAEKVAQPSEETVKVAGVAVSKASAMRLKIYLIVFFAILVILSAVLIVGVVRTTRMRQEFRSLTSGGGGDRPLLEGEVEEYGEENPPEDEYPPEEDQ